MKSFMAWDLQEVLRNTLHFFQEGQMMLWDLIVSHSCGAELPKGRLFERV